MFRLQLQPGKYTAHAILMVHSGPILFLFIRTLTGWSSCLSVSPQFQVWQENQLCELSERAAGRGEVRPAAYSRPGQRVRPFFWFARKDSRHGTPGLSAICTNKLKQQNIDQSMWQTLTLDPPKGFDHKATCCTMWSLLLLLLPQLFIPNSSWWIIAKSSFGLCFEE